MEDASDDDYGMETTQLAEQFPQIDLPQRVDAPESMNAPERRLCQTRNAKIIEGFFSPRAHWKREREYPFFLHGSRARQQLRAKSCFERHSSYHNQLKDLTMLAASSRRSGQTTTEAHSYFSTGVIHDNLEDYSRAVEDYKKFAAKANKKTWEALAYNCIGVDLMHLSGNGEQYTGKLSCPNNQHLLQALKFHRKHLELSDEAGQFVAHTNLGLVLGSLNRTSEAAKEHQDALRLAIKLQSTYGQSIAVGNLSLLASRQCDFSTANACMDQHLQLVQSLADFSAESRAWTQLGILANREAKFEQASRYFEQAYNIATNLQECGTKKQSLCHIGLAIGNQMMKEYMENIKK